MVLYITLLIVLLLAGPATLIKYLGCERIIITLKNHSNPVLINFTDPAETTQLYQQLKSHAI